MKHKVIVAMSGGVDSSVAAYLLKSQGYDIAGVTMSILPDDEGNTLKDAENLAKQLNIPHYSLDLSEKFKKTVQDPFVNEYLSGRTPNPCVICNPLIKWEFLTDMMIKLKAQFIATGHYAEVVRQGERFSLKRAKYAQKDQTYALYRLSQDQLSKTLMPLYKYSKDEVRNIAEEAGIEVFDKPDSQDICFVPTGGHGEFIENYAKNPFETGEFILADGTVMGRHKGICNYTVGQRKGLGISYTKPLFVQEIDSVNNRVILGDDESLFKTRMTVGQVNFMGLDKGQSKIECFGKIRYAHLPAKCVISISDIIKCEFSEPQRAITPGQSAVFYNEDGVVLAGGIIE